MVRNARHGLRRVVGWWICAVLVGSCLGCARPHAAASVPTPAAVPEPAKPVKLAARDGQTSTASTYQAGLHAFDAGQWKKAAAVWRECLGSESDPAARQRALFALASVKLLLAGNDADLTMAMDLLDTWAGSNPPGGSGEDPRFLVALARAFKPGYALKETRAAGDKECAKKLADRDQQVRRMQQQVKALETIHREIQEKKKGLTTY